MLQNIIVSTFLLHTKCVCVCREREREREREGNDCICDHTGYVYGVSMHGNDFVSVRYPGDWENKRMTHYHT